MHLKAHMVALRHQQEPQKQFANSGSFLEPLVNMFFIHD